MSILWCGGEPQDFVIKASGLARVSGSRTGYSRSQTGANTSATARSEGATFASAVTSAWVSARVTPGNATSMRYFGIGKAGTGGGIAIGTDSTTATKIALWLLAADGTTWTKVATEAGTSGGSTFWKWDLQVSNFGASTNVKVYKEGAGTAIIDYTGDLRWTGATDLDRFHLYCGSAIGAVSGSEFIVADEDTRAMSLVTLAPSGAGNSNNWTSGTYADVDEDAVSDADLISSDTADQVIEMAAGNLPSGTWTVKAIKVTVRAIRGASGPQGIKIGVRSGGTTDFDAGRTVDTTWNEFERFMPTNPVTSAGWTQSEADALELAIKSQA